MIKISALSYKHFQVFLLLDGSALRGAYIGALAKQLKRANGTIDIREMHTNAANEVTKMTDQQTPELRDTLSKQL